jgi:proteasome beta subunit
MHFDGLDGRNGLNASNGLNAPNRANETNGVHRNVDADPYAPELGLPPAARDGSEAGKTGEDELKTGTTTVGMAVEEGVVLATDMRASAGNLVASKQAEKILEVHPQAALTISGGVSAAQSLVRSLKAEVRLYESRRDEEMSMQALSTLTGNLLRSGAFFIVHPILGGVDSEGGHIYNIGPGGSVMEEDYTVSGSGSPFALGVLESAFEDDLSADDARDVAARAVNAAIERDTASGNGMLLSTITDGGVEIERFEHPTEAL